MENLSSVGAELRRCGRRRRRERKPSRLLYLLPSALETRLRDRRRLCLGLGVEMRASGKLGVAVWGLGWAL